MAFKRIIKFIHGIAIFAVFETLVFCLAAHVTTQNRPFNKQSSSQINCPDSNKSGHSPEKFERAKQMRHISEHFQFSVPDPQSLRQRFKTTRLDPEIIEIQQKLEYWNLWERPDVQRKYHLAKIGLDQTRTKMRIDLLELIEESKKELVGRDIPYIPATTAQISNDGIGIHILDQSYHNIPMYVDLYSYCLLWLVLGPQGGGKSSAIFHQLQQMQMPFQILDPKGTWEFRSRQLQAEVISPEHLRFDADWREDELPIYLHSLMEGVAYATGLQYGLSCLFEACDIALEQRRKYLEQTNHQSIALCLKDIQAALSLCDRKNNKRIQYLESAQTALDVLLARNNLFTTRSGLPLNALFSGRYILQCRYLTASQSRFLGWFLLNHLYFQSLHEPETTELKSLLVFDDSSKFLSKPDSIFGAGSKTSIWLHLLSVLRSTGHGAVFMDQLVEPICDDVKQLCNNWLIVGGMRGTHNQSEVKSAMGLTPDQAAMLGRLQCREAVCFCPSNYPYAIHGTIPEVPGPEVR